MLPEGETANKDIGFLDIFYEVFSAFGTTGITLGITSKLSMQGKIIIMLLMFMIHVLLKIMHHFRFMLNQYQLIYIILYLIILMKQKMI